MMSEPQLDRILDAIAATTDSESDEAFCDQTQEVLAAYVELELAGERADRAYPAVAHHLAVCPDCREEHESLRALMSDMQEVTLPESSLDLSRLPPPAAPATSSQVPIWARTVQRLAGAMRGREAMDEYVVLMPALGAGVVLHLLAELEVNRASLRGYFTPPRPNLRGISARLYEVAAAADFAVVLEIETSLEDLGEFSFDDLSPGDYVLTLGLPSGEIPVVLLTTDVWRTS